MIKIEFIKNKGIVYAIFSRICSNAIIIAKSVIILIFAYLFITLKRYIGKSRIKYFRNC